MNQQLPTADSHAGSTATILLIQAVDYDQKMLSGLEPHLTGPGESIGYRSVDVKERAGGDVGRRRSVSTT